MGNRRTVTIATDDLSGAEGQTLQIKIVLGEGNAEGTDAVSAVKDLDATSLAALRAWVTDNDTSQLVTVLKPARKSRGNADDNTPAIRAWGLTQAGWKTKTSAKGRLPNGLADAYFAAHPATTPAS